MHIAIHVSIFNFAYCCYLSEIYVVANLALDFEFEFFFFFLFDSFTG